MQAAGYVAGAAALLLSAYQQAGFDVVGTASTVKQALLQGSDSLPSLQVLSSYT